MKRKSIDSQISKVQKIFGGERITTITGSGKIPEYLPHCIDLLVVNVSTISTRDFFNTINLGCRKHNSWFLDLTHAYDLVKTTETSYMLENVNIVNTTIQKGFLPYKKGEAVGRFTGFHEKTFSCFDNERPLTFHEVLNLAFQYPGIFSDKVHGIQAYGSRFTKEPDSLKPATDDTLEIYRKGNIGKGFLKLAREQYRYNEDSKIIPFVQI
jgi:hypothetical protein